MTVKQLLDTLEDMRKVYPFDNAISKVSTFNNMDCVNNVVHLATTDAATGVQIEMSKQVRWAENVQQEKEAD